MKKGFSSGLYFAFPAILVIVCGMLMLNSCKDKGKSSDSVSSLAASDTMKLPCLIITKAMAQEWVDSGWTSPTNPDRIKYLLLQFNTAAPANIKENFGLVAHPAKSMTVLHSRIILQIDNVSPKKIVVNNSIFANLMVSLDSLGIFNPDGTLTNFSIIKFIPNTVHNPPYVAYDVEVTTNNVPELKEIADPCPPCPYCPGGVCPENILD